MNLNIVLTFVFIALVVGLFVLALIEASLLHLRRSEVAVEAEGGDRRAARLLLLLDDLPRVMNAVLLAVLLGQVTATTIAGVLARRWVGGTGITIATVMVTVLLFVYGEAIPKTLAIRQPYKIALRLSGVTRWISVVLRPFVSVLVFIANKQSPAGTTDTVTAISEEELLHLADEAANAGRIEESDAELIARSFTMGDRRAGEIMVPRDDICAVSHDTPIDVALRTAITAGHRRVPVFQREPGPHRRVRPAPRSRRPDSRRPALRGRPAGPTHAHGPAGHLGDQSAADHAVSRHPSRGHRRTPRGTRWASPRSRTLSRSWWGRSRIADTEVAHRRAQQSRDANISSGKGRKPTAWTVGPRAPGAGLEPATIRLTVGCSAN